MRITYLHQYFNTPDMNGSTRSYEMARRWVAEGHTVEMITSDRSGSGGGRWITTTVDGINVHMLGVPYNNAMSGTQRIRAFIRFGARASIRARKLDGDIVFATSTPLTIIVPALFATVFRRTPIVFEVRDLWPDLPIAMGRLRNPVARSAARLLEIVAYKRSKVVVALSPGMAEGVVRRGKDPRDVVVAPNSCDVEQFAIADEEGARFRASQAWLGDRKLVVYCGTFGEINDVSYLVRLAAEVKQLDPSIAFAMFGAGRDATKVTRLAEDLGLLGTTVYLPGPVAKAEIPQILNAATVATSLFKPVREMEANSANKFFDGLAAGRPLAINYGGWQADLLLETGAGLRLSAHDFHEAARQLVQFMSDKDKLQAASVAAARLGSERFDRDAVSMRVLEAIKRSVSGQLELHGSPPATLS